MRALTWTVRGLGLLVGVGALTLGGALLWARSERGQRWILAEVLAVAQPREGRLEIDDLHTDLWSQIRLDGVRILDGSGRELVGLDRLEADLRPRIFRRTLDVLRLEVVGLRGDLTLSEPGLDLALLWTDPDAQPKEPAADTPYSGLPIDLFMDAVTVQVTNVRLRTGEQILGFTDATLNGGLRFEGDQIRLAGLTLEAASTTPALGPLSLRGDLSYDPRALSVEALALSLGVHHVSLSGGLAALDSEDPTASVQILALHLEPELLPWELPLHGAFDVEGALEGSLAAPLLALRIVTPGGPVDLEASLDRRPTRPPWSATVTAHAVALDRFLDELEPTVVDARLVATGSGLDWPADLDAQATLVGAAPTLPVVGSATLDGRFTLSKGIVTVPALLLSTPTGALDGRGEVDILAKEGALDLSSLDVHLADLARFGVRGLQGSARFVGAATVDWSGEAPDVRVDGVLSGRRLRMGEALSVATLRGPLRLRLEDAVLRLNTSFQTTALSAGPVQGDQATGSLSIAGDRLVASLDVLDLTRTVLGVDARGDLGTMRFEAPRLIFSPDETQTWTGVGVQAVTIADDGFDELRLAIMSDAASVSVAGGLHTEGELTLAVAVLDFPLDLLEGFSPGLAGFAGSLDLNGAMGGSAHDLSLALRGTVEGLVVPDALHGVDALLNVNGRDGVVRVDAALSTSGPTTLTPDAPPPLVLATVTGTVPVFLDLSDPVFSPQSPIDLTFTLPASDEEPWNRVLDVADLPEMRLAAEIALTGTPLELDVQAVVALELPVPDQPGAWIGLDVDIGNVAHQLKLVATVRQGTTEQVAKGQKAKSQDAKPLARLSGGATVHLDDVAGALFKRGPAVDLKDPATWIEALDLTLEPVALAAQDLRGLVTLPEGLEGEIGGAIHLRGSLRDPVLDGALRVEGGRLNDLSFSPATLTLAPATGGYDVVLDVGFGSLVAAGDGRRRRLCTWRAARVAARRPTPVSAEGDLHVEAHVPVDLSRLDTLSAQLGSPGLAVDVSGRGVPLVAVAALWPQLRQASGAVQLEGTITGALTAPVADLHVTAKDVAFELESTGVAYDQLSFDLSASPTELRLDGLHVRTTAAGSDPDRGEQGTLDATLEASIQGTTLGDWRGEITYDNPLILATGGSLLRLSPGALGLSGTPPNVTVTGAVEVEEASLRLDDRFFGGRGGTTLPAWLTVNRASSEARAEAPLVEDSGIPDWLELGFEIDLTRNLFLHAELPLDASVGNLLGAFATVTVDAQVDGRLQLAAAEGLLSIEGQVVPIRGTTVLFGRPFALGDDSTVSFTGYDYTSPVLDLHAVYDARAYGLVEASIRGIPSALEVELSSEEYPAQDDVISLLLVGRPASEVSAGEGAAEGASAAALSMLLGTLGQQVGRQGAATAAMFIAPDLLVVGAETASVGKRIGDRIFVVVDLDNTADDIKSSYLLVTVEVALGGPWQGEFVHGTAGEDAFGVYWTRRY